MGIFALRGDGGICHPAVATRQSRGVRLSAGPFLFSLEEIRMGSEEERPQSFVERVLAILEERFPWLGSGQDEPVSGAETVDELSEL